MKTFLRLAPHSVLAEESIVEIWYNGEVIGTVIPCRGPVVRIMSAHPMASDTIRTGMGVGVTQVTIARLEWPKLPGQPGV